MTRAEAEGLEPDGADAVALAADDAQALEPDPDDWFSRVLEVVETIPSGRVMTYGGVAAALGSRSSRGVGKVMAHSGAETHWWRVIRASGHPALGHAQRALEMYRVEGTPLRWSRDGASWRVDLAVAEWAPGS
ncbi:O(6)-alkylguanine repair protein YbaZ [Frondihabitans sp. PhB188]|uniref:MGMT family protein n=1 Tax=Frondihabitans sp. PhB188 TaxID=2485200 RepID=UPI000FC36008|nr:MGMT family protein [Frondihabitans sp. PhB188]ROQ37474.1 O(6)-alkylguanine repair protein YbaZ [Frondihabitans sp. PhB188]